MLSAKERNSGVKSALSTSESCCFLSNYVLPRVHNPQSVQRLIQLCIGSWSNVIGSSGVMRACVHSTRAQGRSRGRASLLLIRDSRSSPQICTALWRKDPITLDKDPGAGSSVAHSGGYVLLVLPRVDKQECATACTTSMLCSDGRTSHHVTWFKRLCWQTVQSDHKRVVPKAGLRTTQYLSCTRVHGFITWWEVLPSQTP